MTPRRRLGRAAAGKEREVVRGATPASSRIPCPSERAEIASRLLRLPNVVGFYLGHKHAGGRSTGEYALVCLVSEKRIMAASGSVPPRIPFRLTSRSRGWIRTDVVRVGKLRRARSLVCGPGDKVFGRSAGTVGIALSHPEHGPVVTTAGHVFTDSGWTGVREFGAGERQEVTLRNVPTGEPFTGELIKVVVTSQADYALVRPCLDFPARNAYHDAFPMGVPYQPSGDELGASLTVLAAAGERSTAFRGLQGSVRIGDEGLVEDALVTDRCTAGGDSGGALVDEFRRVWGLLVGFADECSIFMSPFVPIQRESARFR
jgi:hypothetical protein